MISRSDHARLLRLDFLALLSDAAIACFRGYPERTISRMLDDTTDFDDPDLSGIQQSPKLFQRLFSVLRHHEPVNGSLLCASDDSA